MMVYYLLPIYLSLFIFITFLIIIKQLHRIKMIKISGFCPVKITRCRNVALRLEHAPVGVGALLLANYFDF